MNNVIDLSTARLLREEDHKSSTVNTIEEVTYSALRKASRDKWGARRTVDNIIAQLGEGVTGGDIDECVFASLTGNRSHLLRSWLEVLTPYASYLNAMRFHLATGRQDLMISDGTEHQGEDPYPEPILMAGFGVDPHDNGQVYASASLSARSIWFDGEFQELDKPAVSHHPETVPLHGDTKNLDEPPHARWRTDVNTAKRGMVHPNLINNMLSEFFLSALACNMGVGYRFEGGRHRFSYMETLGFSTIVEWSFVVHSEVYDVYGV